MDNKSKETYRWDLIFKQVSSTISPEEQTELDALQKDVFEKTKPKGKAKSSLVDVEIFK